MTTVNKTTRKYGVPRTHKIWTKEEIRFLVKNPQSTAEMAVRLGRTEDSILSKLSDISVNGYDTVFNKHKWAVDIAKKEPQLKPTVKNVPKKTRELSLLFGHLIIRF